MSKLMALLDDNNTVINIIIAHDDFVADDYIEYNDLNPAYIGGDYVDGYFYPEQPFLSWSRDGKGHWLPPKPKPEGRHYWDEDLGDWIEYEAPTE